MALGAALGIINAAANIGTAAASLWGAANTTAQNIQAKKDAEEAKKQADQAQANLMRNEQKQEGYEKNAAATAQKWQEDNNEQDKSTLNQGLLGGNTSLTSNPPTMNV